MSDIHYPNIQYSTFVNGDQVVLRAEDGASFAVLAEELANEMERAQKAITAFKQIVVATGVFTGDSSKKGGSGKRATDGPPPSGDGSIPMCDKHGEEMKDFAGRGYRKRYYCPRSRDEARGCLPKD